MTKRDGGGQPPPKPQEAGREALADMRPMQP